MKSHLMVIVLLIVLSVALYGCSKTEQQHDAPPPPTQEKEGEPVAPPVESMDISEGLMEFVHVRKTKPVDFEKLAELYAKDLQAFVKKADGKFNTKLDADVMAALDEGKAGKNIGANSQIAGKSIQRAMFLFYFNGLNQLEKNPKDREALTEFTDNSPNVRWMSERRSKWLDKGNEYPETFDAASKQLVTSANAGNAESVKSAIALLRPFTMKMVALSVLYELDGLATSRGVDNEKAAEKKEEARIYYQSIYDYLKGKDATGAETVKKQLSLPVDQIDVQTVQKILMNGFADAFAGLDPKALGVGK